MALEWFYKTFTAERRGALSGSRGSRDFSALPGTYRGFIQLMRDSNGRIKGQEANAQTYRLYAPQSCDLIVGDRIFYSSVYYIVLAQSSSDGISGIEHHKEYECARWEHGS